MELNHTEAKELLARYYAAFNAGDWAGMLALLTDDVVHEVNQGDPVPGADAFARFLDHMDHCYSEQVEDLVLFSDPEGRHGAAEFFIRGTYKQTDAGLPEAAGQTYHLRVGAFFEFRAGRISRVTNYYNLREWLRQVGA